MSKEAAAGFLWFLSGIFMLIHILGVFLLDWSMLGPFYWAALILLLTTMSVGAMT